MNDSVYRLLDNDTIELCQVYFANPILPSTPVHKRQPEAIIVPLVFIAILSGVGLVMAIVILRRRVIYPVHDV